MSKRLFLVPLCFTLTLSPAGAASSVKPAVVSLPNYEYTIGTQPYLGKINVTSTLQANISSSIAASANPAAVRSLGIAILDGMADPNHSDLAGRLTVYKVYSGRYNVYDSHATHVSGLAAASQNGTGIAGVDPNAVIFSIPVFDDRGWVASDLGKAAFNKAQSLGAKVVNMSYGPTGKGDIFLDGELPLFGTYVNSMVLVKAAGNSGVNAINEYYSGTASTTLANILIVGSVDKNNNISAFSNRPGSACISSTSTCDAASKMQNFFIVAPGENLVSDLPGNKFGAMSGTSMATPLVTGAADLVFQKAYAGNVMLKPSDVVSILERSATDLGVPGIDSTYGWGLLNVNAALNPIGQSYIATGNTVSNSRQTMSASMLSPSSTMGRKSGVDTLLNGMVIFDDYGRGFVLNNLQFEAPHSTLISDAATYLFASLQQNDKAQTREQGLQFFESGSQLSPYGVLSFSNEDMTVSLGTGNATSYFSSAGAISHVSSEARMMGAHLFAASGDIGREYETGYFSAADIKLTNSLSIEALYAHGTGQNYDQAAGWADSLNRTNPDKSELAMVGATVALGDARKIQATFGYMREHDALLGIDNGGAFSLGSSSQTQLMNVSYSQSFARKFTFDTFLQMGLTKSSDAGDNIFSSVSDMWSRKAGIAFSGAEILQPNDRVQLSLISPWQIVNGDVAARVAVGREFDGTVDYQTRQTSFGTQSIPLDLGLSYTAQVGAIGYGASLWLRNNDTSKATIDETVASAGVNWRF